MKMIVTPELNGCISKGGEIRGMLLPENSAVVEVESLTIPPATAARLKADGSVEVVANWIGSGPWYDLGADEDARLTEIHISELGIDPTKKNWGMVPREATPEEVAKRSDAIKAKAASDAEAATLRLVVTDVQFAIACMKKGLISEEEALNWSAAGQLPKMLSAAIDSLPDDQRAVVRIRAAGLTSFSRSSSIIEALGVASGLSKHEIDQLFILATKF